MVKIYGLLVESRLIRIQSKVTQTEKYLIQPTMVKHVEKYGDLQFLTSNFQSQFSNFGHFFILKLKIHHDNG